MDVREIALNTVLGDLCEPRCAGLLAMSLHFVLSCHNIIHLVYSYSNCCQEAMLLLVSLVFQLNRCPFENR